MTSGFGEAIHAFSRAKRRLAALRPGVAAAPPQADRSSIPPDDLALLLGAIDRRRAAGRCGRHEQRSEPGCEAVMVWQRDDASASGRPAALFCRDRFGAYSYFAGDGGLVAAGSMADILRWWK